MREHVHIQVGQVTDRNNRAPEFQSTEVIKQIDSSTIALHQYACDGQSIPEVDIHICATLPSLAPYIKYMLSNVIISKYFEVSHHDQKPMEILGLACTKRYIYPK